MIDLSTLNLEDFEQWQKVMKNDEFLKEKFVLIHSGHLIHEGVNLNKIRCTDLINDKKYNLQKMLIFMTMTMNITNEKIVKSNELYQMIKNEDKSLFFYNSYTFSKYNNINQSIVHDIKIYCDKLIIATFLLLEDKMVQDLPIESLGAYLNKSNKRHIFKNSEDFLYLINDLDNSFKHSFSNELGENIIGKNDNCIINYYSKNGKNIFNPQIFCVKLDDIINGFNEFLNEVEEFIKENKNVNTREEEF